MHQDSSGIRCLVVEDLSFLVDTHIAKLSMDANISTLFNVFHQKPFLNYIICVSTHGLRCGVVSRKQFIRRLISGTAVHLGGAYPPVHLGMDDMLLPDTALSKRLSGGLRKGDGARAVRESVDQ